MHLDKAEIPAAFPGFIKGFLIRGNQKMEKTNFDLWSKVEKISLMQAAFLWCGYEPPPDVLREIKPNRAYIKGTEFKEKPLPQMVKIILFQIVNAVKTGQLALEAGLNLNMSPYKHEKLEHITPRSVNGLNMIFTSRKSLMSYVEKLGQAPKFLFSSTSSGYTDKNAKIDIIKG